MAEPIEYKKPSTTPKKRIVSTRTTSGQSRLDNGAAEGSVGGQYNASSRTGAFVAPAGDRNPQTATSQYMPPQYPNPQGQVAQTYGASVTGVPTTKDDSESLYGFTGRHFSPEDLRNGTVWRNPWLISDFALDDRGQQNNIKLKEGLRNGTYVDGGLAAAGIPIFAMLNGLTGDINKAGDSSATINYIANLVNSMTQLGGHVPSYEGLLQNLLSARGVDTVLGDALNNGTATDQVNTFMTYLRAALETGSLNPIAGSAVLSQANRVGDDFLKASMGGQDGYTRNFTDYVNSGGHRLFGDPRYR